jgi:hypothetical protein
MFRAVFLPIIPIIKLELSASVDFIHKDSAKVFCFCNKTVPVGFPVVTGVNPACKIVKLIVDY